MSAEAPPELSELLRRSLGRSSALAAARATLTPYHPPFDQLATHEGWVVSLDRSASREPVTGLPNLPAWIAADPVQLLAMAAGVAADYAWRRDPTAAVSPLLRRESPLAVIVPPSCPAAHHPALHEADALGIPLLADGEQRDHELATLAPRVLRRRGHAFPLGRPHDPALVTQEFPVAGEIGGNALSSFVVHHKGEQDGVRIIGKMSDRYGLEIGIRGINLGLRDTALMEQTVAAFPAFLDGLTSRLDGLSLRIGWRAGAKPTPELLAEVIRAWLPLWYDVDLVDIRLAFAPPRGRSALLTDMRSRAEGYKERRAVALAQLVGAAPADEEA